MTYFPRFTLHLTGSPSRLSLRQSLLKSSKVGNSQMLIEDISFSKFHGLFELTELMIRFHYQSSQSQFQLYSAWLEMILRKPIYLSLKAMPSNNTEHWINFNACDLLKWKVSTLGSRQKDIIDEFRRSFRNWSFWIFFPVERNHTKLGT